ncbi:hypothetical protein [Yinghuangia sp. YIM S09857]|uniref:hypothetical protein n=1 Tax=Yinghuangia sp. YIM S09857 TaxID=3436929 RepID=UPI003F52A607
MVDWEVATLGGGPADGLTVRVVDRPSVLQVVYPCAVDTPASEAQVQAMYVYRRRTGEPLSYGFDAATP